MAGLWGRCTGRELYTTKGRRNRKTKLKLVGNSVDKPIRLDSQTVRRKLKYGEVQNHVRTSSKENQNRIDTIGWKAKQFRFLLVFLCCLTHLNIPNIFQ